MTQEPARPASLTVELADMSDDLAGPQRPRTSIIVPTLGATLDATIGRAPLRFDAVLSTAPQGNRS